jgi:hypothetical protein
MLLHGTLLAVRSKPPWPRFGGASFCNGGVCLPLQEELMTTKNPAWLELKCLDETGHSIRASLEDVLRSPELQRRLTPNGKRQLQRAKDKLREAGRLFEPPDIVPKPKE